MPAMREAVHPDRQEFSDCVRQNLFADALRFALSQLALTIATITESGTPRGFQLFSSRRLTECSRVVAPSPLVRSRQDARLDLSGEIRHYDSGRNRPTDVLLSASRDPRSNNR